MNTGKAAVDSNGKVFVCEFFNLFHKVQLTFSKQPTLSKTPRDPLFDYYTMTIFYVI